AARQAMRSKEVCAAPANAISIERVAAVDALESVRESLVGGVNERVVVVAQQQVGDELDAEPREGRREAFEERNPVSLVLEEVPLIASVSRNVVDTRCVGTW